MYEAIALDPGHVPARSRSQDIEIAGTPRDEEHIPLRVRSRPGSRDRDLDDRDGELVFDAGVVEGEDSLAPPPSHGHTGGNSVRRGQEGDWDAHSPFLENGPGNGVPSPPNRPRKRRENIGDKAGIVLVCILPRHLHQETKLIRVAHS
jgi:hypothetical protein